MARQCARKILPGLAKKARDDCADGIFGKEKSAV
jgi:hypothetical protein